MSSEKEPSRPVLASVGAVLGRGPGQYAVAYVEEKDSGIHGSVTFSIQDAWKGVLPPKIGQKVLLYDIQLFQKGWRAALAEPITPKQQATAERR